MTIKTRKVDVSITEPDGTVVFERKQFEIPEAWTDRAATICASKYAAKGENSALDIIDRVVGQISDWGIQQDYFTNQHAKGYIDNLAVSQFRESLKDILINQRAAFNSPVWFNVGVEGHKQQVSACFILPVEDNMHDILDHAVREGKVFEHGSGAGINISKLRGEGEPLSNGGSSSGPLSFMKVYDAVAGCVKSGGKTRRAAKLVCMDVDHPDIMAFIDCKLEEEKKAKILIDAGIDREEAYSTVAFQNANHSIRVSDLFMESVECSGPGSDWPWNLTNRKDKSVSKTIYSKDILRRAAEVAWETGDPGIMFDDRANLDNPIPSYGKINGANPCIEFMAVDNSSCNLASLNLVKYLDENGTFNLRQFSLDIDILITAMDIMVDPAYYPTKEIGEVTRATRPLGLGFTNLGAYLMLKGIPYDSMEARAIAANITHMMTCYAYATSITLGKKLGSFEGFEENKEVNEAIVRRLCARESEDHTEVEALRNSQVTLLAPTGTISFMMDCDTTGIEPLFALKSYKQLAGGGVMVIRPKCTGEAAEKIAAGDVPGFKHRYDLYVEGIANEDKVAEEHPEIFATANEIPWKAHVDMMAACQPHLNGAISKTINMSASATVEDVEECYMYAWKKGLKALAVYRDGCKDMQPMVTKLPEEKEEISLSKARENALGAMEEADRLLEAEAEIITAGMPPEKSQEDKDFIEEFGYKAFLKKEQEKAEALLKLLEEREASKETARPHDEVFRDLKEKMEKKQFEQTDKNIKSCDWPEEKKKKALKIIESMKQNRKKNMVKPDPAPRYDDVFYEGMAELEEEWEPDVPELTIAQEKLAKHMKNNSIDIIGEATKSVVNDLQVEASRKGIDIVNAHNEKIARERLERYAENPEKLRGSSFDLFMEECEKLDAEEEREIAEGAEKCAIDPVWTATRKKLPDTTTSIRHKFDIAGNEGYIHAGLYEDGSIGEIFINMSGYGSTLQGLMDSFATAVSMALQYGVPLDRLADKFINSKFEPSGITQNEDIRFCSSIVDYVFKWLSQEFEEEEDVEEDDPFKRDVEEEVLPGPKAYQEVNYNKEDWTKDSLVSVAQTGREKSIQKGPNGPPCNNCGSLTVQAGSCHTCPVCGTTTGCG